MALEIFRLVGSIFVDSDAADKSLQKTDSKAKGIGEKLANGAKTAAKWGAAIVGGASAAVGAITGFANKTAETADEIDKMSQRLGISREAYQELDFALSQSGVDISSFSSGAKTLLKNMDAVTEGNKTAISNFEKLGISVTDSSGKMRSQEEVLWDAISAFQGMEDSAEKSRLAQELFGKQGQEILPLLNAQSGKIEEMRQQAHDLGLVLSDEVVDSGVSLHDTMDKLKRSFSAVGTKLGATVMPLVEKLANFILDHMPEIEAVFDQLAPVLMDLFEGLGPPLMELAMSLLPLLVDLLQIIVPIIQMLVGDLLVPLIQRLTEVFNNLGPLGDIFEIVAEIMTKVFSKAIEWLFEKLDGLIEFFKKVAAFLKEKFTTDWRQAWDGVKKIFEAIFNLFSDQVSKIKEIFGGITTFLKGVFSGNWRQAWDGIKQTFGAIASWISTTVEDVKGVFNSIISFISNTFSGAWRRAWEGIRSIFSSIFQGIASLFKSPINTVISGINRFLSGLNGIKIPDWVPLVGGKSFHINTIPYLAKGGVLERGQTGFLEGDGAEAVVPLENNRRWIHAVAQDMDSAMGGSRTEALLADILDKLTEVTRMGVYMDGKTLVGVIAPEMDRSLGRLQLQKARG